jgi:hypothetical protein
MSTTLRKHAVETPYEDSLTGIHKLLSVQSGSWLVACLEDRQIKNPNRKFAIDLGTKQDQRDLNSF